MPASPLTRSIVAIPRRTEHVVNESLRWIVDNPFEVARAFGIALAIYLALIALRAGITRLLGRAPDPASWRAVALRLVRRTNSFFLGVAALDIVQATLEAPRGIVAAMGFVSTVAIVLQGAIWVRELILGLVDRRAGRADDDHGTLASARGIIGLLVNTAIWSLAVILVLDNLGVNVTALVAGLGVGGIAIGLAAQGIFADLFAALSILFDQPFRRGDTIAFGGTTGIVENIGLKTTRLRALTGEEVVIGNTKLLSDQIRNLRRVESRTVTLALALALDTPADRLAQVPAVLRAAVESVPAAAFGRAHVVAIDPVAVRVELLLTIADSAYDTMMDARHAVWLAALAGLTGLEVGLANGTVAGSPTS